MVIRSRVAASCLVLVIFGGCSSGSTSPGAKCVPGASVDCACATNQHGAQTCTAQGTFSACVCQGSGADANGLGGAGGTTSSGTGGQGVISSDADIGGTGGTGGVTAPSTSSGGAGGETSTPTDANMGGAGGAGGTTIPATSSGGAGGVGGATIPATSNGGAGGVGGATIPATSNGGAGGAGGTTIPATSNGGAGGTTGSAICGNGKIEGGEGCDDGNIMPFDGCSSDCQMEPDCSGTSCASACGDGIVFGNEACDDGNHASGDGCSADCKVESGWTCAQPPVGNKIMVPVIYRDFRFHNPTDFESGTVGSFAAVSGMVNATLDSDGKPVYSGIGGKALVASTDTFAEWYRDVPGVNHATPTKMPLWDDGKGGYVNRYGPSGEQWNVTEVAYFCGYVGQEILDTTGKPIPCTYKDQGTFPTDCTLNLAKGEELLKCDLSGGVYGATFIVSKADGNPLFFPVDGDTFTPASELMAAQIPPYYDATASWPFDVDAAGIRRLHNFSFTSEVRYWFLYDKTKSYTLDFVGDDDVWVFINRKLAVDLGGIHPPVDGSIVIGADGNGTSTIAQTYPIPAPASIQRSVTLGLQDGQVYEIAVFQAERQSTGSSFKLTMTGFNTAPSQCTPK
jgi:fibro-slime domain-containing protein